jgi:GMP synthase (glutamine-hydrolysing)
MIVFVDYEHADGHTTAWGEKLLAARTWITYRLEDLSGQHCMLVRYDQITPELLVQLDARALFISGNSVDPGRYDPQSLEPLHSIIAAGRIPTFGFCGGFQCVATALGAPVTPIAVDESVASDRVQPFSDGRLGEMGYHPIDVVADHPLLAGLGPDPVVRHAHYLEVPTPPVGFTNLASTPITEVQMAVDDDRRIVGTQFHPEYYTDEHPAGRQMIENFLVWVGITPD